MRPPSPRTQALSRPRRILYHHHNQQTNTKKGNIHTMQARIDGSNLIITVPVNPTPTPSKSSGKTLIVATTSGNRPTDVLVQGKPLTVSVNAYIKP